MMGQTQRLEKIIEAQQQVIQYEREINKAQSENIKVLQKDWGNIYLEKERIDGIHDVNNELRMQIFEYQTQLKKQKLQVVKEDNSQLLFSTQESLARALGVAQITIWKWLKAGSVPKNRGLQIKVVGKLGRERKYQIVADSTPKKEVA